MLIQQRAKTKDLVARIAQLEALDHARLKALGQIAHELRAPAMLLQSQLDATESTSPEKGRVLRRATRSASRLLRLTDQALQLSKIDAGSLPLTPTRTDVVPFIESHVMSFSELAERKGILLEFIARPRNATCNVDTEHLSTIVTNLLSSAFQNTPVGGRIGVAVEAQRRSDNPIAVITVVHTGEALAEQERDRVFAFSMADRSGLGLPLAQRLARHMDVDLNLDGDMDGGQRFLLTLPAESAPTDATTTPSIAPDGTRPEITAEMYYRTTGSVEEVAGEPPVDQVSILVHQHDRGLRRSLKEHLSEIGLVKPIGSDEEVLSAAIRDVPDIIISDVRLAGADGVDTVRSLRSDRRTSHIPVILLSSLTSTDDRIAGLEAGADEYLVKPVEPRELSARVRALLDRRKAISESLGQQELFKPSRADVTSVDQEFLERIESVINQELEDPTFSVQELADSLAMSTSQMTRKLKALSGRTPAQVIRSMRLEHAAQLVAGRAGNIAEIAYKVGFSDQAHFSRSFKKHFGVPPSEYRTTIPSEIGT